MSTSNAQPSLEDLKSYRQPNGELRQAVVPVHRTVDLPGETPLSAYAKIHAKHTYLFEAAAEKDPTKVTLSVVGLRAFAALRSGPGLALTGDPLTHLEKSLGQWTVPAEFRLSPSLLNGGAFGHISYDCVRYFESKVDAFPQPDVLGLPEAEFVFASAFVFFDHSLPGTVKLVSLCPLSQDATILAENYESAVKDLEEIEKTLRTADPRDFTTGGTPPSSTAKIENCGEAGYKSMVRRLKERIVDGDIIQAVPSHRVGHPTGAHPFEIYKHLRLLNPSRYGFYVELGDFQIVGQSPELLVSCINGVVTTHPIAGTRKRGKNPAEDQALEDELLADEKERAEHIMLVDLGRNDINRVADPRTTNVDSLMHIERYSHVMHIVSCVSGRLRPERTPFDAFRSVFPAGTLSGAPKIRAMELIAQLEPDRRGVYGGAVGYFSFDGNLDTSIAIRTIVFKNGVAWLQAGGGIVFDSTEEMEYQETVNKMAATARAVELAQANSHPSSAPAPLVVSESQHSKLLGKAMQALPAVPPTIRSEATGSSLFLGGTGPTLLVDNFDSFTWNIYQYLCQLGENVIVVRNNATLQECIDVKPVRVVISPGPGWPQDAGVSNDAIKHFAGKVPILGVCLGHECIVELFGGKITHCGEIKHGKTSKLRHTGTGVFAGIPDGAEAIRYHSLAAEVTTIDPAIFDVTARTDNGIIMALRHKTLKIESVQFHPESIKTEYGLQMLKTFLSYEGPNW